jgi:hypothetical protein
MAVPTQLYGSECWTTTKQQDSRIQKAGMKFLWDVESEGVKVWIHAFLTSETDGWLVSGSGLFNPTSVQSTHWIGGLVGPREAVDTAQKKEVVSRAGNQIPIRWSPSRYPTHSTDLRFPVHIVYL